MTTPDQPESSPPPEPNLPPPPGNAYTEALRSVSVSSQVVSPAGPLGLEVGLEVCDRGGRCSDSRRLVGLPAPLLQPSSSECDIRSVVSAFTDDWNKADVTAIRSLWCSGTAPDATILGKQIGWYGHIETSVRDVGGSGDEASAEITVATSHGGEKEPWWFVNEGGRWKPCKVSFIWTNDHGH